MRSRWLTLLIPCVLFLAACGSAPQKVGVGETVRSAAGREKANEVVLFSLGLINIDYRFGGKNPEAGLDCSGMVSYVFDQSVNLKLKGSAADIARRGAAQIEHAVDHLPLVLFEHLGYLARADHHLELLFGDVPAAVRLAELEDQVIDPGGAMLPDPELARQILAYVEVSLSTPPSLP